MSKEQLESMSLDQLALMVCKVRENPNLTPEQKAAATKLLEEYVTLQPKGKTQQ